MWDGSFGFAVGDVFGAGVRGVGEGDFASVCGDDDVVGHGPVFGVGYGSGGGGFDVKVIDLEVDQGGVGVGRDIEGLFCAGGLDVPDVDVGEVGETLVFGDFGGEGNVVRRRVFEIGGEGGVAVAGVPVHGDVDRDGYALKVQVVDADVFGPAAAYVRGFEEDARGNAGERGDVVSLDVAEATGGF